MPKITALKVQARNKNRVNVYLDDEFAFGLVMIEAAKLHLGQVLSDADIERIKKSDDSEMAFEKAVKFISYRPRSEKEVRQNLKKKEIEAGLIDEAVQRLKRVGLLNDEQFAQMWVESRSHSKPKGRRVLKIELRQKGLSREAVDAAVAGTNDEEVARRLAASRAPRLKKLPKIEFRRKLGSYLARRGINYEIILEVVERAWQEFGEGNGTLENED
ncbi:MAG: RecX family transcriptional regulator [Chloroflexi bacterium]|nr:RecX family transcriptional regulator [Chloroflexota bacterium]MBI5714579.1 RecX family transcriptional regulator [Chloroflexota bacterium]